MCTLTEFEQKKPEDWLQVESTKKVVEKIGTSIKLSN